jgi:diguanylate cyclase (GGDEF)-like protein
VDSAASAPRGGGAALTARGLAGALTRLTHAAGDGSTAKDILTGLCAVARQELAVDGAGVMLVEGADLRFVQAVPRAIGTLERLQESLQRGPSRDSMLDRVPVVVDDLSAHQQWPELVAGSTRAGIGSVLSMPLMSPDRVWGVLDLYRCGTSAWTPDDVMAAQIFGEIAASYLALAAERRQAGELRDRLEHRANHDDLTGLPNRGLLVDRLDRAVLTAARHGAAVAVLFIDVDGFKRINDAVGHAAGDRVLVEVAARLGQTLRANDTLARLSGDEFVAVCEDLTGSTVQIRRRLYVLGRRVQSALRRPPSIGGSGIIVSVSIGVVVTTRPHRAHDLIHGADRAMYLAKQRGGGQLVISNSEILQVGPGEPGRPPGPGLAGAVS